MARIAFRCLILLVIFSVAGAAVRAQTKAEPKAAPPKVAAPVTVAPATAAPATDAADKSDPHAANRAAIRAAMDSFVKAFESGDAKGLAAHWTAEGEFHTQAGKTARGREMLEKAFTMAFSQSPERKAEVRPKGLRFLSSTSAIEEGSVTVRKGPTEPPKRARYEALFLREDGRWLLAMLTESADDGPTIEDLAWIIGQWKSTGKGDADIQSTYTWDASKKFIRAEFKITEKDRKTLGGSQMIGIDPATGGIRSWTFEATGGVAEADWQPDGDHWELQVEGTMPDGRTITETNVLRRINADTITWQSVERLLGDTEIPDLAPVKVVRVKSEN